MQIHITYRITLEDFVDAHRFHLEKRWERKSKLKVGRVFFAVSCLLIGVGNLFIMGPGYWISCSIVIGMALLLLALPKLQYVALRVIYLRDFDHGLRELVLSESGIEHRSEFITSLVSWPFYSYYCESGRHFLLYYSPNQFVIVPKSAFASEEECNDFRTVVAKMTRETVDKA
jgi:hypothetical protein